MKTLKRAVLLVLFTTTMLWAGKNKDDFPMRLQFTTLAKQQTRYGGILVQGKGNLLDGNTSYAIDYNGTCDFSFQTYPTSAHISQPARWKKQPYELEALWTKEEHREDYQSCTLKIGLMLPKEAYVSQAGGYKLVQCVKGPTCPMIWAQRNLSNLRRACPAVVLHGLTMSKARTTLFPHEVPHAT